VAETANADKSGFSWPATDAENYRVARGLKADLINLLNISTDFSCYWHGAVLSVSITADDPSGQTDRCYYYLIQGFNGSDPDTSTCMGPAGHGRQVNMAVACP
jgi:hypothetical protein